ncbi:MAG: dienelactone hydrolase family protein [Lachnospiraceae bacterium]|nr:dienelactone hydrolase family protein [Lachnospiraceae bacterium]
MNNKPAPAGEYKTGTATFSLYGDRNIACRIYYPVNRDVTENLNKPRYMSPELAKGLSKTLMFPISYNKIEKQGDNYSECFTDAPYIKGMKFPLIVFSHGAGGYRESNSFMCIELASRGYVVLCIAHPGLAACVEYDNGTVAYAEKNLLHKTYDPYWKGVKALMKLMKEKGSDRELAQRFDTFQKTYCGYLMNNILLWMDDTRRAVDYIKENLSYMTDLDKGIGVTGHSFGGATAYALCQNDPEFVCGINIDGLLIGDHVGKVLKTPFLQISCENNATLETRTYLEHTKPVFKVLFRDMEHLGFSDLKFAIPIKKVVGALPPDVLHENICRCHLEFFDTYLKRVKDCPELTNSDAVTVTEYQPDIRDHEKESDHSQLLRCNFPDLQD